MQLIQIKIIDDCDASRSEIAYWIHYFERQINLYKQFINSGDYKYDVSNPVDRENYKKFKDEIKLLHNLVRELKIYGANKEYKIITVSEG